MYTGNTQLLNTVLIVVGGAILIVQTSLEERNPFVMVLGLVFLMFGLYRATNYWVATKDDHKDEDSDSKEK